MKRLGRLTAIIVLGLMALGAAASAEVANPIAANLDSDSAPERVVAQELCEATDGTISFPQPKCADDQFSRRRIEIDDTCAGAPYRRRLSSIQDDVYRLRVTEADGEASRPEIFFDMRSGATGRGGDVRVVRYDDRPGGCPAPHRLFRYPSSATLGAIPKGAVGRDSFSPALGDRSKRFRGKEIRLTETYVDKDDAFCCPSFKRVTYFRFSSAADRYVRYATRVRRLKRK